MEVKRVIIHEIYKPQGQTGAKLSKSLSLMDHNNDDVKRLIIELNKRYRKRKERHGIFDKDNPTKFHGCYNDYHKSNSDDTFIQFSHESAENLRERIEGIGAAKGGYLVFSQLTLYLKTGQL